MKENIYETVYITTSIPYVNARPHIGFALELVQADTLARYSRLLGYNTRFQTGADENAFKNVLAAKELNISTQELVDRNAEKFKKLAEVLNASPDNFIRTTGEGHRTGVEFFWNRLRTGDVYQRDYIGLYCPGCEDFFIERDLIDGRCPDHGTRPIEVSESNYFFRLSAYQEQLEDLLANNRIRIIPETRKNEVLTFVRQSLEDFSISRSSSRSEGWGIKVPGDPSQTIYVWVDALINYLSGLGYGQSELVGDFWSPDARKIHVIGKNVWKFHAVYWPCLLLSAGLPLPDALLVHGFLTQGGRKISKSTGTAFDPISYTSACGADSVRYFLLRAVSPFEDGDFSSERLVTLHNSDLANSLGNLVSRLASLCEKGDYGGFTKPDSLPAPDGFHEALGGFEFDRALKILWGLVSAMNRDIDQKQPWNYLKSKDLGKLYEDLDDWLNRLYTIAFWLQPFLPDAASRILKLLGAKEIKSGEALFPRKANMACSNS